MQNYSLSHLSDSALDQALESAARDESGATARLLAHLAESDARRRYAPAGYPSMFDYCTRHLRFSEDAAYNRIRVARAARRFPVLFRLIAERRLHLTGARLLAAHLTTENAAELVEAATDRSKTEIEQLLVERFPLPDLPERIVALPLADGHGGVRGLGIDSQLVPEPVGMTKSEQEVERLQAPPARVEPRSSERFAIQVTVDKRTHDALRRAQELLRHQLPNGDVATVLDRALNLLVRDLEKRKCGATDRPRALARRGGAGTNPRHISAEVRRAVWQRDGARCTFVSDSGRRCEARGRLEFDHIEPVARGGSATAGNLRLRCRAHNQLEADRAYGAEFMEHKREASRIGAAEAAHARAQADVERRRAEDEARARAHAAAEVIPWLRALGLRADESRQAAALCERIPDAPLEQRVRLALTCFAKPGRGRAAGVPQHVNGRQSARTP